MMQGSKDEAERAIADAVDANTQLVLADKNRFLDLYAKNPKLAERVAKNFEGINSAKELINYIKGTTTTDTPQPKAIDEDAIVSRVRQQIEQENAMIKAEKQFENLTQEQEELAKSHFEKITKWISGLTTGEILEYAEMAATHARQKLSSWDKDRALLNMASTTISNRAGWTPKKWGVNSSETDALAEAFGFKFTSKK